MDADYLLKWVIFACRFTLNTKEIKMEPYLVFMANLAVVPLQGQNPLGGRIEYFDEPIAAEVLAEEEKLVMVYRRLGNGELGKLKQYHKKKKYKCVKE